MRTVVSTKSVEFMPLPLSVCTLFCAAAWTSYALYVGDIYILIPNSAGLLLGLAQLILYGMYCRSDRTQVLPQNSGAPTDQEEEYHKLHDFAI